jgi:hypothetical protein
MTVSDLIKELQDLPPTMRVVKSGLEGGYSDITMIESIPIKLNQNTSWWYGKHEECDLNVSDETALKIW